MNKLGGKYAPRPSTGPHKLRECIPLVILLRNRLKYALTRKEAMQIVKQRTVQVDAKIRTDLNYPLGFMDVMEIPKVKSDIFRILYDVKGRFTLHRITAAEAKFKLCRVKSVRLGQKGIPFLTTHDGRTIRYPDPLIKANDTIKLDIKTGKIIDFVKFDTGNTVFVTGGKNTGRIGTIVSREHHPGSFDIVHVQPKHGKEFTTRLTNIFVIGKGDQALISVPKDKGIKLSILEERDAKAKN